MAADWQWSVPIVSATSSETNDHPRAFLWVPPDCKQLRGVVIGQHNMEEEPILEHSRFRAAMSELGFAEIWVTPPLDLFFRFDQGSGEHFNEMMKALAAESGYSELEFVPVALIGHSAAASSPWNYAAWNPSRTICALSVSGQWPYYKDQNTPDWGTRTVDGVPGLVSMGEYENALTRADVGLSQRQEHPMTALSMLAEPGAGHFDVSDAKVEYLAFYLKKAAQYRLPETVPLDRPTELKPIDPTKNGWLADRWRKDEPPKAPAAPVGKYTGDAKDAFWFFDEEHAKATEALEAKYRGKKYQLTAYVQDGKVVEQDPNLHFRVRLKFLPLEDGMSFKLSGTFLDTAPEGVWLPAGSPVGHATSGGPVVISKVNGPAVQTGPDTWSIRFYRMGMDNVKRSNAISFLASHPGDEEYRRTVQQSVLTFPLRNTVGAEQRITFDKIPDQKLANHSIKLEATSDANVPVYFYVREGPAELDNNNTLTFTSIPPRAKLPMKITVVGWQWGRSVDPKLKTAEPVEQTFFLTR